MITPRDSRRIHGYFFLNAPSGKEQYDAYVGQIARGAGVSSAGQGIGRILGYATQVALARFFGAAQVGYYVLGLAFVQFANILAMFGMDDSAVRYVARYRAEGDASRVRGTILMVLWVTLGLSVALSVLMFAGADFLAGSVFGKPFLGTTFRIFSVSVPFFTVMSIMLWAMQGFGTVKYATYVEQVLRPLINLGLIVVFYLLGQEILGAIAAYILSMAAGTVLAFYYLRKLFPKLLDRTVPARYEIRELFGVSVPMAVARATNYMNTWATVAILGIFAPPRDVGVYNAAFRTAALCGLALVAFSGIFSPMISALYRRGSLEPLGFLYKDVSRWTYTGSLAIFLVTVTLGREILAVFGDAFVSGWAALVVIAAAQLFGSSVGLTGRMLTMTGHQRVVMWSRIASAVVSVVGGFALIPFYGLLGAAAAMAAGLVLANATTLFFVGRRLSYWPYSAAYLKPTAAGLLAAGATLLAKRVLPLPQGPPELAVLGAVFGVSFVALILAFRLSNSDRQFLKTFWAAVRRNARIGRVTG